MSKLTYLFAGAALGAILGAVPALALLALLALALSAICEGVAQWENTIL